MLTVVDCHKVHTSVFTFVEDELGETIGKLFAVVCSSCCIWKLNFKIFHLTFHLSSSFVNNAILDINFLSFAGAEDRRVTVKQHVFLHSTYLALEDALLTLEHQ